MFTLRYKNKTVFDRLLDLGARYDLVDCDGQTAFMYAVTDVEDVVFLEKLIQACGTDRVALNIVNAYGGNPIINAITQGKVDAFDRLLNAGACTHFKMIGGKTLYEHVTELSRMEGLESPMTLIYQSMLSKLTPTPTHSAMSIRFFQPIRSKAYDSIIEESVKVAEFTMQTPST